MRFFLHKCLPTLLALMAAWVLPAQGATPMVAAGWSHSLALTADGQVMAWGSDNSGQLGIGRQTFVATPQRVPGMNLGANPAPGRITVGAYHSAVVKADGSVWTWGDNLLGQLGDGTITAKSTPAAVPGMTQAVGVAAGFALTAALKADGSVWTWGSNEGGALGTGDTNGWTVALTPVQVNLEGLRASALSAGFSHVLTLIQGYVVAWGANGNGELGIGDYESKASPYVLGALSDIVSVAAGWSHSMALDSQGGVWTWGNNADGRLGDGTSGNARNLPYRLPTLPPMVAIAAGAQHSVALATDGSVWTWGSNDSGQLGANGITQRAVPAKVQGLSGITRIHAHHNHTIALDGSGRAWTWGAGSTGQLGHGSVGNQSTPTRVQALTGVMAADAGLSHTLAVTSDGQLWSWGESLAGQLGTAIDTDRTRPVPVQGLSNIVSVSGGLRHSLAVQADGNVWAWGYNLAGQLGDGTTDSKATPVRVSGLSNVTQVSAGFLHSLARKADGSVWAWGGNSSGELGLSSGVLRSPPARVAGLTSIRQVAAGLDFSLAVGTDGTVWAWGGNASGQLGVPPSASFNGYTSNRNTPARIMGLPQITAVAAGQSHALALASNGTVWAWGDQSNGVLGNLQINAGTSTPTQVVGLNDVVAVAAGATHSMALRRDGTVHVWGLVLTEETSYAVGFPFQFPDLGQVSSISAGLAHSVVAKSDGTVWAWGLNIEGGLGDGTYAFREETVAVINETFTDLLDLNLAQANFPVAASKLPKFFVTAQKTGGKKNTSLAVDLRGLPAPSGSSAGGRGSPRVGARYNIYVAASLNNQVVQTQYFQLESERGWNEMAWPMGEYLRGVALDSQDSVIRAQILTDADLTGLEGAAIYVGYGLDADEMLRSGRYRLIYKVPK